MIKFCFENLKKDIQDLLIKKCTNENGNGNIEGLKWNLYDIKGNIIGDMLPY
jgi:hypothetical protein